MDIKSLQAKISELNDRTTPHYKLYTQKEKAILTKTVKLNEEVGELCNDILGILRLQRKAKMDKFDRRNIYQEFADVIITTMQLASVAGVDLERAIHDKLITIEKRHKQEKEEEKEEKIEEQTSSK